MGRVLGMSVFVVFVWNLGDVTSSFSGTLEDWGGFERSVWVGVEADMSVDGLEDARVEKRLGLGSKEGRLGFASSGRELLKASVIFT